MTFILTSVSLDTDKQMREMGSRQKQTVGRLQDWKTALSQQLSVVPS